MSRPQRSLSQATLETLIPYMLKAARGTPVSSVGSTSILWGSRGTGNHGALESPETYIRVPRRPQIIGLMFPGDSGAEGLPMVWGLMFWAEDESWWAGP